MRSLIAALIPLTLAATAIAAGPTVAVYPPDINLETAGDKQSFIVQLTQPDGITRDVTDQATVTFGDASLVALDKNVVRPAKDGATEMTVTAAGQTVKIPVKVTQAGETRPVSFKLDVMPVFMRAGCNVGGCHGAARGKDGFRLSLFGFDPEGDHYRLTRELNGRRINLAVPEASLLLDKTTGKVPHTGGAKFKDGDQYASRDRPLAEGRRPARPGRRGPADQDRRLPAVGRPRRGRRDPAGDRPGRILRRDRPGRDRPDRVPD